jgi:hypothetical protein
MVLFLTQRQPRRECRKDPVLDRAPLRVGPRFDSAGVCCDRPSVGDVQLESEFILQVYCGHAEKSRRLRKRRCASINRLDTYQPTAYQQICHKLTGD